MAEKKKSYLGETVELADKDTGFYDPETQLQLSRDNTAKIEGKVGRKTQTAILSGRLLIVGSKEAKAAKAAEKKADEAKEK